MIRQPTLLIPFHARVAVAFGGGLNGSIPRLVGGSAIGVVLFVGDNPPGRVTLQTYAAQVISILIAKE